MAPVSLVSVVGARPQFVKLAPLCRVMSDLAPGWRHHIIHTGQHYDHDMSEVFFDDLNIPRPDRNLNIGSGKHGMQTSAMMAALEQEFETLAPRGVVVYGDTNSTLAAALVAAKLQIPQFHVEAGLRSFDRSMPEEINRIVADHCAELLFAPTEQAMVNLGKEGLAQRAVRVGDVMYDAVLYNADIARQNSNILAGLDIKAKQYAVATIHRPANTDRRRLRQLMETFRTVSAERIRIVFPMHPRTRAILDDPSFDAGKNMLIIEPQPYIDMLALVQNASLVLTDSGGLQKEAAFLGTACITLRDSTEWTETIEIGANRLAGLNADDIRGAIDDVLAGGGAHWLDKLPELYGDGRASDRIVKSMLEWLEYTSGKSMGQVK